MGHVPCQWCIMVTHHRSRKWKYIRIFDLKMCHQLRICLCCPPPDNVYDSKKITVTYDKIRSKPVEKWEKRPICFGCVLAIWRDNNRQQSIGDSKQMAPTWMLFFFCCADTMHLPMDQSLCQRVDGVFSIRHEYCIVCGTPAQYNLPPIIDTHCERKHRRIAENIFVLSNPISFILVYSRCWAVWMWTF